jgi:hypothetical protein
MAMKLYLLTCAGLVLAACGFFVVGNGERVMLVVQDNEVTYYELLGDDSESHMLDAKPGQYLGVVRCVYWNKMFYPEIELSDGRKAYVAHGKFALRREGVFSSSTAPISFSC